MRERAPSKIENKKKKCQQSGFSVYHCSPEIEGCECRLSKQIERSLHPDCPVQSSTVRLQALTKTAVEHGGVMVVFSCLLVLGDIVQCYCLRAGWKALSVRISKGRGPM